MGAISLPPGLMGLILQGPSGDKLVGKSGPSKWKKELQDLTMETVIFSYPYNKIARS